MASSPLENQIRYITNTAGEPTDVLIPLALWQKVLSFVRDPDSGLAWIDEHEPNAQILADLQTSLQQSAAGQTFPVATLWNDLED